jgi:hypothetical protein
MTTEQRSQLEHLLNNMAHNSIALIDLSNEVFHEDGRACNTLRMAVEQNERTIAILETLIQA